MNKTELIVRAQENIEIETTKKNLGIIVDGLLKTIQDEVVAGGKVQLVGFGTFEAVERAARTGRNPLTGEALEIAASKTPKFKAGKAFKDAVKNA